MPHADEERSRAVAESARQTEWGKRGFLRALFLGRFELDLIRPYPLEPSPRPRFEAFCKRLESFLLTKVDPAELDERGEYPREVLRGLAEMGAFGMKIPEEYGGLGFTQREYERAMMMLGSYDANLTALLSAHQSIGVPQPLQLFGTVEQKKKYLPRCAAGAISGFALTEPAVGSDPARIGTTAELAPDGTHYVLNGTKLWCTNGTLAELLVVMARTGPEGHISAFIVETRWPGVKVSHRCHFMGLRALANGELVFRNVRVPKDNLLGEEGRGLKLALVTLNTGRLSLPAATTGGAKRCLEIARKWAAARVQWGQPIGKHEAIAHKLADMAGVVFAMESVADLASDMAGREGYDIRLEAAAAKEWNTVRGWEIVDDTLEIRGGRGYENERSLEARGEAPIGVERMMRDSRVNRIFEGSSEIMHLFMAREAVDKHLRIAGALIDPRTSAGQKVVALVRAAAFYSVWYLSLWRWGLWPRYRRVACLGAELRFVERSSRKLARSIFYGMLVYRAGLEKKQAFLFRAVDIAMELFAMAATVSHAEGLAHSREAVDAQRIAGVFCRSRRRIVRARFRALWRNQDALKYRVGLSVLEGADAWLEDGAIPLGLGVEALRPKPVRAASEAGRPHDGASSAAP